MASRRVPAPGIRCDASEAEATRRRLMEMGALRDDLKVERVADGVWFPVVDSCGPRLPTVEHAFEPRPTRPSRYVDLLDWPAEGLDQAPRAFDRFGDIVVLKVPDVLQARAAELGDALLRFVPGCRAVFHDGGVVGPFRVRDLSRIAGTGGTRTHIAENGVRLVVDPAAAYFSPRLAEERARVVAQVRPAEHLIDLFGGVAPLGIQAARAGAVVDTVDVNPQAIALAKENIRLNRVEERVQVHEGDARQVAPRLSLADRVVMNLPHGAAAFLDAGLGLARVGGIVHLHEIVPNEDAATRQDGLQAAVADLGRTVTRIARRVVRAYSADASHLVFDLEVA